jgi:hypothetical protein
METWSSSATRPPGKGKLSGSLGPKRGHFCERQHEKQVRKRRPGVEETRNPKGAMDR